MSQELNKVLQDKRYSLNLEFCGASVAKWVLRFCGDFISSHENRNDAILKGIFHQDERTIKILG